MLHGRRAAILLRRRSRGLLGLVRRVLGVRLGVRARLRLLCGGGRCRCRRRRRHVDFDVSDGVSLDIVRVEAVAARREEDCAFESANTNEPARVCSVCSERSDGDAPSCRVKVAFCGLTAATTPCTSVFGGFCRVTMTEIPMKPDAMVGVAGGRERRLCAWWGGFDDLSKAGGVGGVIVCRP